jgi:uncharacterized protein (TIGR00730 family)
VYCGSNSGADPVYAEAAVALGRRLADRGIGLVYGGGHVGMMGTLADAALAAGGEVTGVITSQLVSAEVAHRSVTTLEVVDDMHQRKARFEQLADGFIALPGGFGTVEELFEMVTWNQLGLVRKPVVLLDVAGYWSPLVAWVDHAVRSGFVRAEHTQLLAQATGVDQAIDLALGSVPDLPAKWLDQRRRHAAVEQFDVRR